MPHQTPMDAIAAAIERANIDFPHSDGGGTWPHTYRPMDECCHLAQAVISGLEKWGYSIVPSVK
jgi:hypothetical protein